MVWGWSCDLRDWRRKAPRRRRLRAEQIQEVLVFGVLFGRIDCVAGGDFSEGDAEVFPYDFQGRCGVDAAFEAVFRGEVTKIWDDVRIGDGLHDVRVEYVPMPHQFQLFHAPRAEIEDLLRSRATW